MYSNKAFSAFGFLRKQNPSFILVTLLLFGNRIKYKEKFPKEAAKMRRHNGNGRCIAAVALLVLGIIFLCCISWRFMLFIVAAFFIILGIILIRKC